MCGIIGIIGEESIVEFLVQGMIQLQHRGQDAAGVFLCDPHTEETTLRKRLGWVFQLFQGVEQLPKARWGLGHIRYSTSGKGCIEDAQPLVQNNLALVHNGNLVNYPTLRDALEKEGTTFQTSCDSETILHILSQSLSSIDDLYEAVKEVYARAIGAYSIIGIVPGQGMFAFRDPRGIRPLLLGKNEHMIAIASETLALSHIGCKDIQDIPPGEVVWIDASRQIHRKTLSREKHNHCAFEFNYFARTPTIMEGKEIYSIRAELGRLLAEKIRAANPFPIDIVIPIPDTGNPAGIALSHHLNIPIAEGFVRHPQTGRTFIIPGMEKRNAAASQKLTPVRSAFEGKNILLVDDSIIRGTVSKRTITLARNAGASKILFASTFPPVIHPCIYGIDFPHRDQLIAAKKSLHEIAQEIGADAVIYNDAEDLKKAIGLDDLCLACVTGKYPTSTDEITLLQQLREKDLLALSN